MLEEYNEGGSDSVVTAETDASEQEYQVGPGRPPKEHQFKPGQSGNPKALI
jgi:hypothetical protein